MAARVNNRSVIGEAWVILPEIFGISEIPWLYTHAPHHRAWAAFDGRTQEKPFARQRG
jgi:hypothetical protein